MYRIVGRRKEEGNESDFWNYVAAKLIIILILVRGRKGRSTIILTRV